MQRTYKRNHCATDARGEELMKHGRVCIVSERRDKLQRTGAED